MYRSGRHAVAIAALGLVMACEVEDGRGFSDGGGIDTLGGMGTGGSEGGATGGGQGDGSGGGGGPGGATDDGGDPMGGTDDPLFDLPPIPPGSMGDGCAAVDFLFVIDNSISMQDQQNQLKGAFPEFISTIENTLPSTDYHIMVADTDRWGRCDTANPWNGSNPNNETCNAYVKNTVFDECDRTRGAGVVHPAGKGSSNESCNLYGGNRYIIEGQPDVPGAFSCIASVGLAGHPEERPLDGIVRAATGGNVAGGGCNQGFLRDDAILVVTFISDDGNKEDENTPQEAYDKLVAAKGGNADAIVVLGLINEGQSHWLDFISKFGERGSHAPVNGGNYNQFFLDAVTTIADTCYEFEG